jgi:membrane protein YdbS with pleckstrin-like domain
MLDVTGWVIGMWLRITLALAVVTGVAWLVWGSESGWFWAVTAAAVAVELFITRQLSREWRYEAELRWWWTR